MSAGRKEIRQRTFLCLPLSQDKAFTFVEVLFASLIGALIIAALFYALSGGQNVNDLSSAKARAQAEARMVTDWVNRDLRQTVVWELANNSPSPVHIKFRPVLGWDIAGDTYQLAATYIEYNYDSVAMTLTRNIINGAGAVLQSWVFSDIITSPFFTRDNTGTIIPLDSSVGTSKKVITLISVTKLSDKGVNATTSLTMETKIRNE